jgi:hypothetical protein
MAASQLADAGARAILPAMTYHPRWQFFMVRDPPSVLAGTNRIFGLATASQIASASAASVLFRFTKYWYQIDSNAARLAEFLIGTYGPGALEVAERAARNDGSVGMAAKVTEWNRVIDVTAAKRA